jgi:hypothetical protein
MPACGSARGGAGWRIEGSVSRADTTKQLDCRVSALARPELAKSALRNLRTDRDLRNSVKTADGFPLNFVRRAPAIARAMFAAQRLTTMRPRKCAIGTRVAILCGMSGIRKTMEGGAMRMKQVTDSYGMTAEQSAATVARIEAGGGVPVERCDACGAMAKDCHCGDFVSTAAPTLAERLRVEASTLIELAGLAEPGSVDLFGDPISRADVLRRVSDAAARLLAIR